MQCKSGVGETEGGGEVEEEKLQHKREKYHRPDPLGKIADAQARLISSLRQKQNEKVSNKKRRKCTITVKLRCMNRLQSMCYCSSAFTCRNRG